MKSLSAFSLTALFLGAALALSAPTAFGQSAGGTQSLRGPTAVDEINQAPEVTRTVTARRFDKTYRPQPPLPPKPDPEELSLNDASPRRL